jgi:hypothetical protein
MVAAIMAVASTAVAMLAGELVVRFVDGYSLTSLKLRAARGATPSYNNPTRGDAPRYAAAMQPVPGLEASWFREEPGPLPNRRRSNHYFNEITSSGYDFVTNIDPFKIWNLEVVKSDPNRFKHFPGFIFVFMPQDDSPRPPFLFFPNSTTPAGFVTNQFGFRGRPIAFKKPANVIRIAFLGSSATAGFHRYPFSYPELVEFWLNRWAEAKKLGLRFEIINAGREGMGSSDIAKIFTDEVLPLEPDIAIYYEGGIQFDLNGLISPKPQSSSPRPVKSMDLKTRIFSQLRAYSAIWRRIGAHVPGGVLKEGPRPTYTLTWPSDVDEQNPDLQSPNLPVNLPIILRDLDVIDSAARGAGAKLIVSSYKWLVYDGMTFDPALHNNIYEFLEQYPWRYGDIRRLADFQNRVLRRYAEHKDIGFIDIDRSFPNSPDLFMDAVHKAYAGEKIHAWIVINWLLPHINEWLAEGALPRKPLHRSGPYPMETIKVAKMPLPPAADICGQEEAQRAFDLKDVVPAYKLASIEAGDVLTIRTGPEQWLYAAEVPVPTGSSPEGEMLSVSIEYRVVSGRVGFGILTPDKARFVTQKLSEEGPGRKLSLSFPSPQDAAGKNLWLNIFNASETGASVVQIRAIDICYKKPWTLEPIGHGTFGGLAAELAGPADEP